MADAHYVSITEDDVFTEEVPLIVDLKVLVVEHVFGLIVILTNDIIENVSDDFEAVTSIGGEVFGILHSDMAVDIVVTCMVLQMHGVDQENSGIMISVVLKVPIINCNRERKLAFFSYSNIV